MLPLWDIVKLVLESLAQGLLGWINNPDMIYFPIMIAVVLTIVLRQHVRQAKIEEHLFGAPFSQPLRQTLISLGFGLVGGFLASVLMLSLGIALSEQIGIIYIWPVVLVLMLVSPRFMCFAYGGGVVGAAVLLLRALNNFYPALADIGFFADLMAVDLPALMALVGLLHLTEAFLIFISGHLNASPIVVKPPRGEVVGGFMLQRFWPMPIAALLVLAVNPAEIAGASIDMPNWWPLLKPLAEPDPGMILLFSPLPIVAALGYSDIAVVSSPRQKSRWSARNLFIYSVILLGLAIGAGNWPFLVLLPVLFAPLGHEILIQAGNRREWNGKPRLQVERGVKLLATLPSSPARDQDLDADWTILGVNGIEVNSAQELAQALNAFPGLAEIDVLTPQGELRAVRLHQREGKLGLVPAPDDSRQGTYLNLQGKGFLLRMWDKLKKKQSGA